MYYSSKYRSGHAAGGERWPASPRHHLAGHRSVDVQFFCLAEPRTYSGTVLITHAKTLMKR